jgi:hypothetical protein
MSQLVAGRASVCRTRTGARKCGNGRSLKIPLYAKSAIDLTNDGCYDLLTFRTISRLMRKGAKTAAGDCRVAERMRQNANEKLACSASFEQQIQTRVDATG